jgi:CheY-like chemotaxis protein
MVNILLVDDSRVTREVTKVYLIAKNVTVLDARNGEEALRVLRENKTDLVVADMQMPQMDGIGLCGAMQQETELKKIPVIILTSNADEASRERCLKAGAREVLTKPVGPASLIASIKRHLSTQEVAF